MASSSSFSDTGDDDAAAAAAAATSLMSSSSSMDVVVDKPSPENQQQQQQQERIDSPIGLEQAVAFWSHPSLESVSSQEKLAYFRSKGMTTDQIHRVWEELVKKQRKDPNDSNTTPPTLPTYGAHHQQPQPQPQQQQPYSSSYYYHNDAYHNQHHHQQQQHRDGSLQVPALLTIGGIVGLTAAAAVRWLNGGDFSIFPPPTIDGNANLHDYYNQHNKHVAGSDQDDDDDDDDDDVNEYPKYKATYLEEEEEEDGQGAKNTLSDDTNKSLENLRNDVQELATAVRTNMAKQEKILRTVSSQASQDITNKSMALLTMNGGGTHQIKKEKDGGENDVELTKIRSTLENLVQRLERDATNTASDGVVDTANVTTVNTVTELKDIILKLDTLIDTKRQRSLLHHPVQEAEETALESANPTEETTTKDSSKSGCPGSIRESLERMVLENDGMPNDAYQTSVRMVHLYLSNLSNHSHVPKYRKIYTSNDRYQTQVKPLVGADGLLGAVGFAEKTNCWEWQPGDSESEMKVQLKHVGKALSILLKRDQYENRQELLNEALAVWQECA